MGNMDNVLHRIYVSCGAHMSCGQHLISCGQHKTLLFSTGYMMASTRYIHRIYPTFLKRFLSRVWYVLWVISCGQHFISCGLLFSTGYPVVLHRIYDGIHRIYPQDIPHSPQQSFEKYRMYPVGDVLWTTFYILWRTTSHRI